MPRKQYDNAAQLKRSLWEEAFRSSVNIGDHSLNGERARRMSLWKADPWAYLTGTDLPGARCPRFCPQYGKQSGHPLDYEHPIIWTTDERDDERPIKPFPGEKEYLYYVVQELMRSKYKLIFIPKARQMYTSSTIMLLSDWYASFYDEREIVVSKLNEKDSIKLINDKIRDTHRRMPAWVQEALRVAAKPADRILYESTRSTITAVAQNFAFASARGITGSLIVLDEAAYQPYLPDILRAVMPMAVRVWAVSTANIGNPGANTMKEIVLDGDPDLDQYADLEGVPEEFDVAKITGNIING